jgi:hypothetical protein
MSAEAPDRPDAIPQYVEGARAMTWVHDLPSVSPQWSPRQLSASEVVRLVQGDDVPGVDPDHVVVRRLRRGLPNMQARLAFSEARRQGYLFVNSSFYPEQGMAERLRDVWMWWCAAAGHPQIVLSTTGGNGTRIRCDVSTTGNDWSFGAFAAIGRLVEPLVSYQEGSWLFTTDELHLDGVEMDEAIHIARALVDLGTAGRFREGVYDEGPAPTPQRSRFPGPLSPMERTAG